MTDHLLHELLLLFGGNLDVFIIRLCDLILVNDVLRKLIFRLRDLIIEARLLSGNFLLECGKLTLKIFDLSFSVYESRGHLISHDLTLFELE